MEFFGKKRPLKTAKDTYVTQLTFHSLDNLHGYPKIATKNIWVKFFNLMMIFFIIPFL